jgi:hypothetical protein
MYNFRDVKYELDQADNDNHGAKLKVWTERILPHVEERFLSRVLGGQRVVARHEAEKVLLRRRVVPRLILSGLLCFAGFSGPCIV